MTFKQAADNALRFLAGLNLQDHSIAEQREQRRIVSDLKRAFELQRAAEVGVQRRDRRDIVNAIVRDELMDLAPMALNFTKYCSHPRWYQVNNEIRCLGCGLLGSTK